MKREFYRHEKIKELRDASRLTQAELAERVNIHKVSISRIETGMGCSFDNLCQIAAALGVPWWQLLRIEIGENNLAAHSIPC